MFEQDRWRQLLLPKRERLRRLSSVVVSFVFLTLGVIFPVFISEASTTSNDDSKASLFVTSPTVRPNPVKRAPLICIVDFETKKPMRCMVDISDGSRQWQQSAENFATSHSIVVMGLVADRVHEIRLTLKSQGGDEESFGPLEFTTQPLPANFPPLQTLIAQPDRMEPGVRLFAVNNWTDDVSLLDYGFLIAVDTSGQVVWYCETGDRIADVKLLKNGNLIYQHGSYRYLYEIDMLGRDHRSWYAARSVDPPNAKSIPVQVDTIHHDLVELPNGNFLALATELRKFERYPKDEFDPATTFRPAWAVCDEVVEFQPDSGDIVQRLSLTDLLDTQRFGYLCNNGFWKDKYDDFIDTPCRDWSHANALQYLPEDQALLISLRHQDCIVKLDWRAKKLNWILGDPTGWSESFKELLLKPSRSLRWPYHQHTPHFARSGRLLMFDNSNYRAIPPNPGIKATENDSRIVAFQINEASRTVEQAYSYGAGQGERFYSPFYGEAEELAKTGNLLITDGGHIETDDGQPFDMVPGQRQWARIFEITKGNSPEKVFELRCASPLGSPSGWSIYRGALYPSLYQSFDITSPSKIAGPTDSPEVHSRGKIRKRNPLELYIPVIVPSG